MTLREFLDRPGNSQERLAIRLQCSQGLISQWLAWLDGKDREQNATRITAERAIEIEAATDNQVTRYELRPDIFGSKQQGDALGQVAA